MRRRSKRILENDTVTVYDYDAASQMTGITHQKTGPTLISSHAYGYDDAGQRLWVKRANGQGDVYAYDPTDPLISRQDAKTQRGLGPQPNTLECGEFSPLYGRRLVAVECGAHGPSPSR